MRWREVEVSKIQTKRSLFLCFAEKIPHITVMQPPSAEHTKNKWVMQPSWFMTLVLIMKMSYWKGAINKWRHQYFVIWNWPAPGRWWQSSVNWKFASPSPLAYFKFCRSLRSHHFFLLSYWFILLCKEKTSYFFRPSKIWRPNMTSPSWIIDDSHHPKYSQPPPGDDVIYLWPPEADARKSNLYRNISPVSTQRRW